MDQIKHHTVTTTTRALIAFTINQLCQDDTIELWTDDRTKLIDALEVQFHEVLKAERARHAAELEATLRLVDIELTTYEQMARQDIAIPAQAIARIRVEIRDALRTESEAAS